MQHFLFKLITRHPGLGGVALILIGLYTMAEGFSEGARYAEFEGGARVVGRVVSATYDADRTPSFAAEVAWIADGVIHRGLAEVLGSRVATAKNPNPGRPLRPGSELRLVVSKTDPEKAISAERLAAVDTIKLAGKPFDSFYLGFSLIFCFAPGAVLVFLRNRIAAAMGGDAGS